MPSRTRRHRRRSISASVHASSVRIFIAASPPDPWWRCGCGGCCGIASSRCADGARGGRRGSIVHVAAGDHDVLELGARGDVGECAACQRFRSGVRRVFSTLLGVDADRVAAGAEAAIDRADVERQEQRLVVIAVRQTGCGGVGALVERVQGQARVIGQLGRGDRQELDPQRVAIRIGQLVRLTV